MLTLQYPTLSPNLSSVAKDLSVLIAEVHFLGGMGKLNLSLYYLESPAQIKSEGSKVNRITEAWPSLSTGQG